MRGVATPMAGLMESTKTPMGKKTPVGMKSPKGHKSADRYATSGTGPAPSNHKKKVGGRMVNEAKSRGVDSIMSRCDDFLNPGVMYSTVGTKTRTPKSGWGQEMDYEEKGREALERAKRRFGGGQDGHRRGKKGGDEDKKGVVPAANGSQPETPGSSTTAEAKETSAGGKVQDPRSLLKAKAGRVWGDIKNMTRTHLDKQGDSVTKQVSETIKVVRGDDDAQQQRPQEGEDHRRHPQHAPIESVGNVNSRYFAAKVSLEIPSTPARISVHSLLIPRRSSLIAATTSQGKGVRLHVLRRSLEYEDGAGGGGRGGKVQADHGGLRG